MAPLSDSARYRQEIDTTDRATGGDAGAAHSPVVAAAGWRGAGHLTPEVNPEVGLLFLCKEARR